MTDADAVSRDPRAPLDLRALVTPRTMWEAPHIRWLHGHTRELLPSARVSRGEMATVLPRRPRDLLDLRFDHAGREWTLAAALEATDVDGWMVIHDGAIGFEHYARDTTAETRHLCQSVSKSMTSALAGALVGAGRFDVGALVSDYVGELAGTAWEGCAVQHLLDMTAGVSFDESDYDDMDSEAWRGFRALGWLERLPGDPSPAEYVAGLRRQAEHGAEFEYRSICTDVLGWCLERATGEPLADLFSEHIWKPIGAAHDGDFIVGPGGFPLADGGFCVTLRDLALFGLLYLQEGEIGGRQVLPHEWARRLRTTDPRLAALYATAHPEDTGGDRHAASFYHDHWWVSDAVAGVYWGYGIHGQAVLVHHPSNSVVARFSTWPVASDDEKLGLSDAAALAVCEAFG
jgi:CubicO group peptidase (beta-lactamase class C family)